MLLDGAGIPGTESICCHGAAWYIHRLGGALLGRLSRDDGRDLIAVLAEAIDEIAADHRGTCDITNPSSPQATVAIARLHESRLEYLLLADCFLVLDQASTWPLIITDAREAIARRICLAPLTGVARGAVEYERIWDGCVEALQARRNHQGGYWIAKDDPHARNTEARIPDDATVVHCTRLHGHDRWIPGLGPLSIVRQVCGFCPARTGPGSPGATVKPLARHGRHSLGSQARH